MDSRGRGAGLRWPRAALAALVSLGLAGCTIEVGPPPESDPPLVAESAKAPPPPPQPTEPQAWSRDLNLDAGPNKIDPKTLADGLVAAETEPTYSGQRLTYESAFNDERPLTEAEKSLKRARERAEAAGVLAPQAAAAPVTEVDRQALPALGNTEADGTVRKSRLPPPPKFPTTLQAPATEAGQAADQGAAPAETMAAAEAAPLEDQSGLPPPPKMAPLPPQPDGGAKVEEELAAAAPEGGQPMVAPEPAVEQSGAAATPGPAIAEAAAAVSAPPETDPATASFLAEAWDAPAGTILVQVSAVEHKSTVIDEWRRLQQRYPQVLEPLRLVVEEAKLGDRGVFFRVQGGAFGSQEGATAACDSLISQGQACFVVVR